MPVDAVTRNNGRRDPGAMIVSQLEALSGARATVTLNRERPWASITFAGTRYSLAIVSADGAEPETMQALAQALPNHEFAIPGHFLADILITEQTDFRLLVEILSIIDPVDNS